jgi:hypothetical protein
MPARISVFRTGIASPTSITFVDDSEGENGCRGERESCPQKVSINLLSYVKLITSPGCKNKGRAKKNRKSLMVVLTAAHKVISLPAPKEKFDLKQYIFFFSLSERRI